MKTTNARLVVSRTTAGGIAVREHRTGRLLGYTVPAHTDWVACVRAGETWAASHEVDPDAAEKALREELDMPARPAAPCPWCCMDPESADCCGGDHPDAHALAAEFDDAPEIYLGLGGL